MGKARQGVSEYLSADLPFASLEALTVGALEPGAALCLTSKFSTSTFENAQ